jgi:hypothetical protein
MPASHLAVIGLVALMWLGDDGDRAFLIQLTPSAWILLVGLTAAATWILLWPT